MNKFYRQIVFFQGDDASEALQILDEKGSRAVIKHLAEYDFGDGDICVGQPRGTSDRVARGSGYILNYNLGLGYIGLCRQVSQEYVFEHQPKLLRDIPKWKSRLERCQ